VRCPTNVIWLTFGALVLIRCSSFVGGFGVVRPGKQASGAHGKAERSEPDQGLAVPANASATVAQTTRNPAR